MAEYENTIKTLDPETCLDFNPQGQMFASRETIRMAIFDVIDHGDQDEQPWKFYEDPHEEFAGGCFAWSEDMANSDRSNFVDAVIARIKELQLPPHSGIRLQNLCDKHKRAALPVPTAPVCGMCQAERKAER